ncbi:response regulator [Fodinicola acaciae]|uniref:response regulator n=1 Tax=Fodinicola acaciae TaxID=2681555 RepID=UPI0013D49A15|nr:response regulator transcription factor [Fodinicola acaciae]
MSRIRVLIADDHALVRAGFRTLVETEDDMELVGEASTGQEVLDRVRQSRADVVLMDIRMPGMDGIEATSAIAADEDLAGVRVLVLTTFDHDEHVLGALRAGASGFLVKDTDPAELLRAIRVIASGDGLLSPGVTRRMIARIASTPEPSTVDLGSLSALTEREREVVTLVAEGLANDEIAERLFISPTTAKTHVSRALTKTGARDRAQLVAMAYRTGLVTPP